MTKPLEQELKLIACNSPIFMRNLEPESSLPQVLQLCYLNDEYVNNQINQSVGKLNHSNTIHVFLFLFLFLFIRFYQCQIQVLIIYSIQFKMLIFYFVALYSATADLTIDPNSSSLILPNFQIYWFLTPNSTIVFNINSTQYGYFALNYLPVMAGGDMSIIQIKNNVTTVKDYQSTGEVRPTLRNTSVINVLGTSSDYATYINVKFQRPLNVSAQQGYSLTAGASYQFSMAWRPGKLALSGHGKNTAVFTAVISNNTIGVTDDTIDPVVLRHGIILTICWCFLADVALFLVTYRFRTIYILFHAALLSLCIALSLYSVLTLIQSNGGWDQSFQQAQRISQIHYVLGLLIIVWIFIQLASGSLSRILQLFTNCHPKLLLITLFIHKYSGYILILLAKINTVFGWSLVNQSTFLLLLGWNLFILLLFVVKKLTQRRLNGQTDIKETKSMTYQNVKEPSLFCDELEKNIKLYHYNKNQLQLNNFFIFRDYVFDITKLLNGDHPAGSQILSHLKGRQVDRFLYGMYTSEYLNNFRAHTHSAKCLELVGQPLLKLNYPNIYDYPKDTKFLAESTQQYSHKIYIVNFRAIQKFNYIPPNDLSHIGKYFTVTGYDVTRLYTLVTSKRSQNIKSVQQIFKILQIEHKMSSSINRNTLFNFTDPGSATDRSLINQVETIPLVIKRYPEGVFTSRLFENITTDTVTILQPCGTGIGIDKIKAGKIVILAGGTGIFPFLDLFDIIFKSCVYKSHPKARQLIQRISPSIHSAQFDKIEFIVYLALNRIQDIYSVHLNQMAYICKKYPELMKLTLRVKENFNQNETLSGIAFTKEHFSKQFIQKSFQNLDNIAMIYICGPPEMNYSINKTLIELNVNKQLIYMV